VCNGTDIDLTAGSGLGSGMLNSYRVFTTFWDFVFFCVFTCSYIRTHSCRNNVHNYLIRQHRTLLNMVYWQWNFLYSWGCRGNVTKLSKY